MVGYLSRRVAWAALLFLAITVVTFVIFFVVPTEPSSRGRGRAGEPVDVRTAVAIDGPVYEEYGEFLWRVVGHAEFGESWVTRREVDSMIADAAPVTASLVIGGVVAWLLIAVPVGLLSAIRPRSLLDRTATVFVLIGISAHPIWLGLVLLYFAGAKAHLFPLGGYCDLFSPETRCGGPVQWAWHLVLPWLTFAVMFAAIYMRMIRVSVLEALQEDYVRTARAKGAPERTVIGRHVLRNAAMPVVTMLGMDIGMALGAAIFVERVYGLPGLGGISVAALSRRDLPVILGVVVLVTAVIVVLNLVVDLLYGALDPRSRAGSGSHGSNLRSKWDRDRAPSTVSRGSPPSKRITVGSESTS